MRSRSWPWLVLSIGLWVPLIMPMNGLNYGIPFWPSELAGLLEVHPERHADERGHFARTYDSEVLGPVVQMSTSFNEMVR